MAFVNADACECISSGLDLFSVPPTQRSIESGRYIDYHPQNPLDEGVQGTSIEFEIPGAGEEYTDLRNTLMFVRLRVTKRDKSNIEDATVVAPTNLFLQALFSQVDVYLNGTPITTASDMYPYRAYFETLLSYGEDAKKSQLTSSLFYKDDPHRFDSLTTTGDRVNSGFVKRRSFIEGSKQLDMIGRIHSDLFFQERYLLNQVNVKLRFIRSRDAFALIEQDENRIVIEDMVLYVRKVKLSGSMLMAHADKFKENASQTAKYPVRRVVCKAFTVASGLFDVTHEKIFSGQLPNRIIIGIIQNPAFTGQTILNPFNFEGYNMKEISVFADGQNVQNIKPLEMNYSANEWIRAYNSLYTGSGRLFYDEGLAIDRTEYPYGYALYAFDLSPDLTDDDKFELLRTGSVRLQLKFSEKLPHPMTIVVYAEFQNMIEIDRNRNVLHDFSA